MSHGRYSLDLGRLIHRMVLVELQSRDCTLPDTPPKVLKKPPQPASGSDVAQEPVVTEYGSFTNLVQTQHFYRHNFATHQRLIVCRCTTANLDGQLLVSLSYRIVGA